MTDQDGRPPALSQPAGQREPEGGDPDFADEHKYTAVEEDIVTHRDDRESESPEGWAGLESRLGAD